MRYAKSRTSQISFPLGGIGAGCIALAGNGRLIDWEIFNHPNKNSANGLTHFAIRAERNGAVIDWRLLLGDLPPPYTGENGDGRLFKGFGWGPCGESLAGLRHFRKHNFSGEFPRARIEFQGEPEFPASAALEAWSIFIPGNSRDSSLPAACFEIELTNTSNAATDYTVVAVLGNPFPGPERFNRLDPRSLTVSRRGDPDAFDAGDLTIGFADEGDFSGQEYLQRGGWRDSLEAYLNDLRRGGRFANRSYAAGDCPPPGCQDHGLIARHFTLQPGESRRTPLIITWSFPNCRNDGTMGSPELAAAAGIPNRWKNFYAVQWPDSAASFACVRSNYKRLRRDTMQFHDSLFFSSLPRCFIEGISANLAVLKSPTCLRLEDGTFYGWEGSGVRSGSCHGSCTHVWGYAQALAFLFPDLERSMRESHLKYSVDRLGGSHFRLVLPPGVHADTTFHRPCADGQFGEVMRFFRDWKLDGDSERLCRWWPTLRKTIAYAWNPDNPDRWDPDAGGVLTGRQHHTLDMELFGPNSWLTGYYIGALLAAEQLAAAAGDAPFAARCADLARRGREWVERHLFNGEYFIQAIDLADRSLLKPFPDADHAGDSAQPGGYWNRSAGEIQYQIGDGCAIDMAVGDYFARLYGLGPVYDDAKVQSALRAIFKYNYRSMRDVDNSWRMFSLNSESGVLICTWPDGTRRPATPLTYHSETMTGFEWTFAAHLAVFGLWKEAAVVVKAIRDRYDGVRRNPWNEIECGSNYARSLASYGLIPAAAGFSFDLVRGRIGFRPTVRSRRFASFWSIGPAWGRMETGPGKFRLEVDFGELELRELAVTAPPGSPRLNGRPLNGTEVTAAGIRFTTGIRLRAGDRLEIIRAGRRTTAGRSRPAAPRR